MDQFILHAKKVKGKMQNLFIKFKRRMNWFDISSRLDTADSIDNDVLFKTIDSPNKVHGGRYVPTDLNQLRKSLDKLIEIDNTVLESGLIDIGCGKGRVLIIAERMGFKSVIGVEYSQQLYDICVNNLKKAKSKNIELVHGDAVEYQFKGNIRTFYFYNSFDFCLFEKVLVNIKDYLKRESREGYLIYMDPRKVGKLDPKDCELLHEHTAPLTPFQIYRIRT